jgi:hypothetical protein
VLESAIYLVINYTKFGDKLSASLRLNKWFCVTLHAYIATKCIFDSFVINGEYRPSKTSMFMLYSSEKLSLNTDSAKQLTLHIV